MITKYSHKKHYKAIASWYHARDMDSPPDHMLPEIGYIVDGKVAGWLYRTDSTVALIDGIISNPHSLPSSRKQALEVLAGVLLDTAVNLGYTTIIATSAHPSVKKLCEKHNFEKTAQTVYILNEPMPFDDMESDNE